MMLRFITPTDLEEHPLAELAALKERTDGFLWLDIDEWTPDLEELLAEVFGFHRVALGYCRDRNHIPFVHGYDDHIFLVVHRPLAGEADYVHLVELDQFIGERYLVTVHGPVNPLVSRDTMLDEVTETISRMQAGRIWPATPVALAYALMSLVALRQRVFVQAVARRVADLEARGKSRSLANAETNLEEMFTVRHELVTVRTLSSHCAEVLARARRLRRHELSEADDDLLADVEDLFRRIHRMTDGEQEFLAGVIELYRTRTDTKIMIAGERLAVIAAITLPITALSGVMGMNVIVSERTHLIGLTIVLLVMLVISGILLRYTKRQGWW